MEVICNVKTCKLTNCGYDNYIVTDNNGLVHCISRTIYDSIRRLSPNMNTPLFSFLISPNENSVRWPPIGSDYPRLDQGLLIKREESKINKNLLLIK